MANIKELYKKNIYGVMGTLIFHILLFAALWLAELNTKRDVQKEKEDVVLLDLVIPPPEEEKEIAENDKNLQKVNKQDNSDNQGKNMGSNYAVNDAIKVKKDKFFDASYDRDIEDAKKMVSQVNKQLSKKIPESKQFTMPEATTEGQNPDSIKNTIYSGKSNIHYYLENRFHLRLPIPVFLAKGGGLITIDIQVDRSGKVVKAQTKSTSNVSDPMLPEYALQAAERTIFNADNKAPDIQRGTITYRFVAQ